MPASTEMIRETIKLHQKMFPKEVEAAGRAFYLMLHDHRVQSGLCSSLVKKAEGNSKDHLYRPEGFYKVFVAKPELLDSDLFSKIIYELKKTVIVTRKQNQILKKFSHCTTSTIYQAAGIQLCKKTGHFYKNAEPIKSNEIIIPEFMTNLEKNVLGRVDAV